MGSGIRSGSDIARPSDPLIVEAAEPQAPDPEIDGGELVLDDPPPSWRSVIDDIIGHRPGNTSAATGQEDAGKRGAPLEAQRSRKPNGKQSEVSPVKTPSVAKLEAMIQKSADPDTTRRVWEEVLRRQQLQKDIPKVRR